jgi:hypothetical protein
MRKRMAMGERTFGILREMPPLKSNCPAMCGRSHGAWGRAVEGGAICIGVLLLRLLTAATEVAAEQGVLVVHVSDVKDRPMAGVRIATEGDGATGPPTDPAGKTRIRLAPQTRPGMRVTLQIVGAPVKRDLVFISPWDRSARVPSFENESDCGIGSESGRCLRMADYVRRPAATRAATAAAAW